MRLIYSLSYIPDLSMVKYKSLSDDGVEGVIRRNESFLRQWQKISAIYNIELSYIVRYVPESPKGERLKFYIVLEFDDNGLEMYLRSLMNSASIVEFYDIQLIQDDFIDNIQFSSKGILKKCERKRCTKVVGQEELELFYVEAWKQNSEARLYEMFNAMSAINKEVAYKILLQGTDDYDFVCKSLEKPISFLRNKTINRVSQEIKLNSTNLSNYSRDVVAEEILKNYEEFIKSISNSPCYKANIEIYSNSEIISNLLLNTVCGEAIEEGNWTITTMSGKYGLMDSKYQNYHSVMPNTLSYWPTHFTLDEVAPFFRLPILYEGENIEIKKETEPKASDGELYLGKNAKDSNINLPLNLMKKHAFVCGVPGAGKTNTMLHICNTLWKKCGIPFLVLEPAKKEYRALAKANIDELLIFSPASGSKLPIAINPFEFAKGLSLSEHIQNLMDVFEGAFPLSPPLPALLDRAIEGVYKEHGWDTDDVNNGDKDYPTMSEVYSRLEFELNHTDYDGEVRGNMKSALEMRIGSLLRRDLGNVFDVEKSSISPEKLLEYPIVIEMESLGTGPSNFMTLMLCTLIREVLKADPIGNDKRSVRHMIFIEEAHNLIASETGDISADNANPKIAATNYIVKMLAEVRALREGIVIADQLPTAMAPEVLKNTGLKIVHRLTAEDDRALVGSTMSANGIQMEELASYLPGTALISYEGLMRPFDMQIEEVMWKEAPSTLELYELMKAKEKNAVVSNKTFDIRFIKLKKKWMHEWDIAMVVYEQLKSDCGKLKLSIRDDEIRENMNKIVRDQLGLEKCIEVLKTVIKKYKYTLSLALYERDEDYKFYGSMTQSLDGLIQNTKIILSSR